MSREREVCPTCKDDWADICSNAFHLYRPGVFPTAEGGKWGWEWGVEFTPATVGPGLPKPWIEWLAGATERTPRTTPGGGSPTHRACSSVVVHGSVQSNGRGSARHDTQA